MSDKNIDKKNKFRLLPIRSLFPNMITIMALCAGLSSIKYALDQKWEMTIIFIIIAGFLDGMDGRVARMLGATSNFGAQLDSISDFLSFGIAPSIVLYLWNLHNIDIRGLGWAFSLFYCICCAIRLARFNSNLEEDNKPSWANKFFVGVPSPSGAVLALTPMMIDLRFNIKILFPPIYLGMYLSIVGLLMVSRIPTFSLKKVAIPQEYASIALLLATLLFAGIIMEPWIVFPAISVGYILLLPVSYISYNKIKDLPFYED